MTISIENLRIKIFADGADIDSMLEMNSKPYISGLTTNPTLMRKAGITDYKAFATEVLQKISDKPISFEVFSDDLEEMKQQGIEIASWGENVYVKVPITNTDGQSTAPVIEFLAREGVKVNVTAIMTAAQVKEISKVLQSEVESYISVFAGRIADTGRDPINTIRECLSILEPFKKAELIWASPRELLNIFQAEQIGCHIITATIDILSKLQLIDYDLNEYSLDTVKMFFKDAKSAGYKI